MLERLDAAVAGALQPLQGAMESNAAADVLQPLTEVRRTETLQNSSAVPVPL